jgi:hypothetical protein
MFNITESFKAQYKTYLQEKAIESNYSKSLKEYEDAQKHINEGFEIINSYFTVYPLLEKFTDEEDEEENDKKKKNPSDNARNAEVDRKVGETLSNVFSFISKGENLRDIPDYQPVVGHATVQKISEMKFPENIIFFFQQLMSWIVGLIKKFISFFTNAVQRLFGLGEGEKYEDDIRLNLQRSKKIESLAMPLSNQKDYATKRNFPKAVSLVGFDINDFEKLQSLFEEPQYASSLDRSGAKSVSTEDKEGKQVKAIDINISKEMEGIHQLLQYFFNLFDNSYGSNREHLFGTEDLEMLMQLFQATIKDLGEGTVSTTALSGKLTSMQLLSADKLKDNLIRTKVNTDNLKKVYVEIQESITNMLAILSHKQLIAAEGLGVSYRFYSASTYVQMVKILDAVKPRVKQAEQMEKDLKKMQAIFDKLVVQLGKQRQVLLGFGQVTYTSVYQRKISELFDASRYVSQTISLRLATLGLFIRQIKDIQESIYNVNAINSRNKDFLTSRAFQF